MKFSIKDIKNEIKVSAIGILVLLVVSIVFFAINNPGQRRVFYFNDLDTGSISVEIRYLPKKTPQGEINYFIDELLLGPLDNRMQPLFSRGTCVKDCFVSKDTLYLNISELAVLELNGSIKVKDACMLLKKNIKRNFPKIKNIELYIGNEELTL